MSFLKGLDPVLKRTKEVVRVQRSLLRSAARAGATEVRNEARRLAKRKTGQGAKGIVVKDKRITHASVPVGQAVVTYSKPAFYLAFQETGVKVHEIKSKLVGRVIDPKSRRTLQKFARKKRPRLSLRSGGFVVFRYQVQHPGFAKAPILATALERASSRAVAASGEALNKAMQKVKL